MIFKHFIRSLCLIVGLDLALGVGIYYSLPDTKKLISGTSLVRTNGLGRKFTFTAGPRNKSYLRLDQISKYLKTSVLLLEDARFYQHNGFDFEEILNSLEDAFDSGSRLRGASTISQQLVKNLYLTPERTFKRKILEALITTKLELTLTKSQILEIYLNSIDWGRGLLGIQDAAHYYFKKSPARLNVKESVFLSAIIPNPTRFGKLDPEQTPKRFVRKQMMRALQAMYRSGLISFTEYESVMQNPYELQSDEF